MAYCTFEDVQARLRADLARWDEDHVDEVIEAVSERIDEETQRTFSVSDSESRVYEAQRDGYVTIDDATAIATVTWEGSAVDDDEYKVRRNLSLSIWSLIEGPWKESDEVTVTGTFGFAPTVPSDIWDVAVTWTARALKKADAGLQDGTAIPELGQLVYSAAIPANVRRVLNRYTRRSPVLRVS